jgi:hypothetical protein
MGKDVIEGRYRVKRDDWTPEMTEGAIRGGRKIFRTILAIWFVVYFWMLFTMTEEGRAAIAWFAGLPQSLQ